MLETTTNTSKKLYVTFGSAHRHEINGQVFDFEHGAIVSSREEAFRLFGRKFCTTYRNKPSEFIKFEEVQR